MIRAAPLLALLVPLAASAQDPLQRLYGHGLALGADGEPVITARIDDGEDRIAVEPRGAARLVAAGEDPVPAPPGALVFRIVSGRAARIRSAVLVEQVDFRDKDGAREAAARWTARGYPARLEVIGGAYGIRGRVLDTRRYAIVVGESGREEARDLSARVSARFGVRTELIERVVDPPSGTIEVRGPTGDLVLAAPGVITLETGEAGAKVEAVEHDAGYDAHGRSERSYRGTLHLAVGPDGKLAAVAELPLEELLRGIVPAEIYASAPPEALAAQAVTARGEILAKIGTRHLADPFAICSEQHCQVWRGAGGAHASTDAAIARTRGEVLLDGGGHLVDTVFSSTCGGHTEDDDAVWGGPPDPVLRGVPDADGVVLRGSLSDEATLRGFLAADVPAMCRAASLGRADRYRWERRFTSAELDRTLAHLGLGKVVGLDVTGRGSSGRATGLAVTGERGATVIRGELAIRRALRNLNSSMFVIDREGPPEAPGAWVLRGGGWGHGVGMCQMGAIGRAEAGHDHDGILRAYYRGASLGRLYGQQAESRRSAGKNARQDAAPRKARPPDRRPPETR